MGALEKMLVLLKVSEAHKYRTTGSVQNSAWENDREEADSVQDHGNNTAVHSVLLVVDSVVSVGTRYDGGKKILEGTRMLRLDNHSVDSAEEV